MPPLEKDDLVTGAKVIKAIAKVKFNAEVQDLACVKHEFAAAAAKGTRRQYTYTAKMLSCYRGRDLSSESLN